MNQTDRNSERTLTVYCESGLCNRLRVLLSGMALAEASKRKFTMVWPLNNRCNCHFENLFQNRLPIVEYNCLRSPNIITFGRYKGKKHPIFDILGLPQTHLSIMSNGWLIYPNLFTRHLFLQKRSWEILKGLKPIDEITAKLEDFKKMYFVKDMLGVHMRRGDYYRYRPAATRNLPEIKRVMIDFISIFPYGRIFVSTDDGAIDPIGRITPAKSIKEELKKEFGDKVVFTKPRSLDRNVPEAIQDALLDLLLLRETDYFAGTNLSSFSQLAVYGREVSFAFYPEFLLGKAGWGKWYILKFVKFLKRYFPQLYLKLRSIQQT